MEAGTYVIVFEEGGDCANVVAEDETRLDCAVAAYLDSAGTRDSLVHLTLCNGERYTVRASTVKGWKVSTPEGRLRAIEYQQGLEEEHKSNRQALGIWENE